MKRVSFDELVDKYTGFSDLSQQELNMSSPQALIYREQQKFTILDKANQFNSDFMVIFEDIDFCSSNFGKKVIMGIGQNNTYKTISEIEGKWIGDLPSERLYPTMYATVDPIWRDA